VAASGTIDVMSQRLTFRRIAVAVGIVALALIVTGWTLVSNDAEDESAAESVEEWTFVTEPDLTAPVIDVSTYKVPGVAPVGTDDWPVILGVKDGESRTGPLIVDGAGNPVWIGPTVRTYDVRMQRYNGKPVLTYWRGDTVLPHAGAGEFVVMNQAYKRIATVSTRGVMGADYHEMTLTDRGTALLIGHRIERRDLSAMGGPSDARIANGIVQEVDIATGKVVFHWDGLEHIPPRESLIDIQSYRHGTRFKPYDYTHINAITEYGDDLLISARNTSAVYRVDRDTGKIVWTLGGKDSDFRMLGDSRFFWQHDAELQSDGTITLFDNQASPAKGERSRGLRLALDLKARTARAVTEYLPPDDRLAGGQGNLEVLPSGRVFVGWGNKPYYSEYTADGELLLDADLGAESYRSYRSPWVGRPSEPPALTVEDGTAYVSWNGSTEVAAWRFLAGPDAAGARDVGTVRREGFETSAEVPDTAYLAVQALDADGRVLATVEH
jgi:Arylsulfotransferase (ASST)